MKDPLSIFLIIVCLYFSMVTTLGGGSGSSYGAESIDERMCEFIMSEITRGIIEANLVIFGTIKKGSMELLDERLGVFERDYNRTTGGSNSFFSGVQGSWSFRVL